MIVIEDHEITTAILSVWLKGSIINVPPGGDRVIGDGGVVYIKINATLIICPESGTESYYEF